jgi:hypothetical protein
MKIPTLLLLILSVTVFAGDDDPILREPVRSTTHFSVVTNGHILLNFYNYTSGSNWTEDAGLPPISLPYAYKDTETGTVFYVESDGRHVSAISPEGKILWSRDPFADTHLPFHRTDTPPTIVFIGRERGSIAIKFSSSLFGNLEVKTGDFTHWGQLRSETLDLE